ncbi:MAG TPA: hypothetical protein VGF94_02455 [Kofleriaceae bacterium]
MIRTLVLVLVLVLGSPARADESDRAFRGSVSAGGTLLLTGDAGDRQRGEVELDVEPWSRFGGAIAWRGFDGTHDGLVTAGIAYEAAASRPRLVLDLHGDIGLDLDERAPVVGGGVRTVLAVIGPVGVALDTGAYLVIDGVDHTRLQIATGAALAVAW